MTENNSTAKDIRSVIAQLSLNQRSFEDSTEIFKISFDKLYADIVSLSPSLEPILSSLPANYIKKLFQSENLEEFLSSFCDQSFFMNHSSAILLIHLKGEQTTWHFQKKHTGEFKSSTQSLDKFQNLYFSSKKTKNKFFKTTDSHHWLPYTGHFLMEDFSTPQMNFLILLGGNEILPFSVEKIDLFSFFIKALKLKIQDLASLQFRDHRINEIICLFEAAPLSLKIYNHDKKLIFENDVLHHRPPQAELKPLRKGYFSFQTLPSRDMDNRAHFIQQSKIDLLGELFNVLKHELSNPLFGLTLGAEMLQLELKDSDHIKIASDMKLSLDRAQNLISGFAKLWTSQEEITQLNVVQHLEEALTLAKSETKFIKIHRHFNPQPQWAYGIPLFLVQIFFNLIVNSAQALSGQHETQARIDIFLTESSEFLNLTFQDNGPGLNSQMKDRLFQFFETSKKQGHGIGLALSRVMAKKMNVQLLYADCESKGATFIVKIPKNKL